MMLQGDFYIVTENTTADNNINAVIEINAAHKIFEGHFPQQPVVPGVCMVQIIKELIENAIAKKIHLRKADNIKFLSVIDPRVSNIITVTLKYVITESGDIAVNASLSKNEITYLKFKGSFTA